MCNKTVRKLKNESRRTNVNATIHDVFCDGPVRGFTATLNSNGLKWVSDTYMSLTTILGFTV